MDRIEKLKEFLEGSPDDSFIRHALALEYIKLGKETEAKEQFETLLAADPGYVGSYYHLGKLLERSNDTITAIKIYETGMEQAKKAGDQHAYGELRGAYEELVM